MIKQIAVLDFDDTLVFSSAKIRVYNSESNKLVTTLSSAQFNHYRKKCGDYMCFEDFESSEILNSSTLNHVYFNSMLKYIEEGIEVAIVTARGNKRIIKEFLDTREVKIKPSMIYATHDPSSELTGSITDRKKQAVEKIISKGYNDIIFYDDSIENLKSVKSLESNNVNVKIVHVQNANKEKK